MQKLDLSNRPTFRKNYLQPALDVGFIERTIPDKPNSRLQRYQRGTGHTDKKAPGIAFFGITRIPHPGLQLFLLDGLR